MKKTMRFFLFLVFASSVSSVFGVDDSIVKISDLNFHSDFEEKAFFDYLEDNDKAFNLYLAIDETMTEEKADELRDSFSSVFSEFEKKKVSSKKSAKKVRLTYSIIHNRFLKKYEALEFFPSAFETGKYNCVSASMLYSIVFKKYQIPYRVMASTSHVYLVANPGINSIIIETTNPTVEDKIFTGEYKRSHVQYLRESKMISEEELRRKSVDEIFESQFHGVNEVDSRDLPGVQYYNKAYEKFEDKKVEEAYELAKKALFFFKDDQVEYLYSASLLFMIEKSKFTKLEEIDLLSQLARLENADTELISGLFQNIINHHQQFTNQREYCDSLYQRLLSNIDEQSMAEEISFNYNFRMAFNYHGTEFTEHYLLNACKIHNNHRDLNQMLEGHFTGELRKTTSAGQLLDEVNRIREVAPYQFLADMLLQYEMLAYAQFAEMLADSKKIKEAESYIEKFEQIWPGEFSLYNLERGIAGAYRSVAIYYFYRGYKTKARGIVDKGLEYVPESRYLKSAVY